jgi:hypothetical protein
LEQIAPKGQDKSAQGKAQRRPGMDSQPEAVALKGQNNQTIGAENLFRPYRARAHFNSEPRAALHG